MALPIKDVQVGETLLVYRYTAHRTSVLYGTAKVTEVLSRKFRLSGLGDFSKHSGEQMSGETLRYSTVRPTPEELARAEQELQKEDERQD